MTSGRYHTWLPLGITGSQVLNILYNQVGWKMLFLTSPFPFLQSHTYNVWELILPRIHSAKILILLQSPAPYCTYIHTDTHTCTHFSVKRITIQATFSIATCSFRDLHSSCRHTPIPSILTHRETTPKGTTAPLKHREAPIFTDTRNEQANQESANFFCKGPDSKCFRICRPFGICCCYSNLPHCLQYLSKWVWVSASFIYGFQNLNLIDFFLHATKHDFFWFAFNHLKK